MGLGFPGMAQTRGAALEHRRSPVHPADVFVKPAEVFTDLCGNSSKAHACSPLLRVVASPGGFTCDPGVVRSLIL